MERFVSRIRWLRLCLLVGVIAAALPASAMAAGTTAAGSKQLWTSTALDRVANDVAGTTDMNVILEDDPGEWATYFPPGIDSDNVLGFVSLDFAGLYHKIVLSPLTYTALDSWLSTGTSQGNEFLFAVSVMTLIHESFHWRLLSGDESTVNACALKYFPYYLEKDFAVAPTVSETTMQDVPVTTTTTVLVTRAKVVKRRVKLHGKWRIQTKRTKVVTPVTKTNTTYVSQPVTTTVPNPEFQLLVAGASSFYAQQPAPYNAGTCSV